MACHHLFVLELVKEQGQECERDRAPFQEWALQLIQVKRWKAEKEKQKLPQPKPWEAKLVHLEGKEKLHP